MANTVSPNFSDEDLETQIRLQFPYNQMHDTDFKIFFNQITDEGEYYQLKLRGRVFRIDKQFGEVTEVTL